MPVRLGGEQRPVSRSGVTTGRERDGTDLGGVTLSLPGQPEPVRIGSASIRPVGGVAGCLGMILVSLLLSVLLTVVLNLLL